MSELLFSLFSRLFPHLQQEAISGSGDLQGQRLGQKKGKWDLRPHCYA